MTQRDKPARRKRPATPQEIAAGTANLERGREVMAERRKAAKEAGVPKAKVRWAQLIDGTLTVKDLDDEEIQNMRPRGADGAFGGKKRAIPSHLAQQFRQEAIRRAKDKITQATPEVTEELLKIAKDPDTRDSDRIKVLMYLMDRQLGKTPDVIRLDGESDFDALLRKSVGLDRDMADAAREAERLLSEEGNE